ncbi:uncharacterized protein LOC131929969 [Physella acuta]|uniref:uncharacterized protein LOC131929969 n=1 Tax=Physella acuta TaxID=109671 RepID=UPI0027DDC7C4|nr:uncharacterized protein LOC131929969 [Physella acuta]
MELEHRTVNIYRNKFKVFFMLAAVCPWNIKTKSITKNVCTLEKVIESFDKLQTKYRSLIGGVNYTNIPKPDPNNVLEQSPLCGQTLVDQSETIVMGEEAPEKSWPWNVYIETHVPEMGMAFCGGAILNEWWVLTAAHCLLHRNATLLVYFGLYSKSKINSTHYIKAVKRIHNAKLLEDEMVLNDIMLLKLEAPITFTDDVRPVCLPDKDMSDSKTCFSIGFGKTGDYRPDSNNLMQIKTNPMNQNLCMYILKLYNSTFDYNTYICLDTEPGQNICSGDSGGPLLCKENGKYYVVGVIVAGLLCDNADFPSVAESVYAFLDWIYTVMKSNVFFILVAVFPWNIKTKSITKNVCTLEKVIESFDELQTKYRRVIGGVNYTNIPKPDPNNVLEQSPLCGQTLVDQSKTIVMGEEAPEKSWPWSVYIETHVFGNVAICGGSILTEWWILTASHCLVHPNSTMFVYIALYSKSKINSTQRIKVVKRIHKAKLNEDGTVLNDIMVLKLESPITFTDDVRPVCLPDKDMSDSKTCFSIGYGKTGDYRPDSTSLLQIKTNPLHQKLCMYFLRSAELMSGADSFICLDTEPGQSTCSGDSGGPLLCKENGKYYVVGVTAAGFYCDNGELPPYTESVYAYLDWIKTSIKSN